MSTAKEVGLPSELLDELADIERHMELWDMEAVLLGRNMDALAAALRVDASQIKFTGDLIVFEGQPRSSDLAPAIVDLARIRNVVCNLKALKALRKQLLLSGDNRVRVLPQTAETVGVSRSAISRRTIDASVEQLQELQERRWENVQILVIYIDGQAFAEHHIITAIGVDREGKKHILGIEPGATENAASVKHLLTHLRDHGLPTDRKYVFVIDGAKALRASIEEVFGCEQPVQRCRNHKMHNVLDELPKKQHRQTRNLMHAAWKVKTAEEGENGLEQLARFLEREHESAAHSLREGLKEMFTLQRLQIPESLHTCLATTNVIESPFCGVKPRTHNITRWRDAEMAQCWVASAWLFTEEHSRRIYGHENLWALAAILGRETRSATQSSSGDVVDRRGRVAGHEQFAGNIHEAKWGNDAKEYSPSHISRSMEANNGLLK
jgi:transposase-like protein